VLGAVWSKDQSVGSIFDQTGIHHNGTRNSNALARSAGQAKNQWTF
jgi:hypothetical protein